MSSKYVKVLALFAVVGAAACADDPSQPVLRRQMNIEAESFENTYLIRFKNNAVPGDFAARVAALGGEVIFAHAGAGVAAVSGLAPSAAEQLSLHKEIAAVDADAYTVLEEPNVADVETAGVEPESPTNPASAAFRGRQLWNMTAIGAYQVWSAGKFGSASVKVGILDTGIDYLHPDLAGRVDLTLSRSFLSQNWQDSVQKYNPGAHPIADQNYHGTHVAATVASNAWLAAGVTSEVTLVGLKVCNPGNAANGWRGSCPTSGTLSAILYAADNGLPIINMSLGGSFHRRLASSKGGFGPSFLATINNVMNYANRNGTVVVVSAGNSAIDMDNDGGSYKSYCDSPHVVCVSATGPTAVQGLFATAQYPAPGGVYLGVQNPDALAGYSNFGGKTSVAAPGGNAIPVWAACSGFTRHPWLAGCRTRFYNSPTSWRGSVVGLSGTSMASPHTAGLAALIASHIVSGAPQIKARLFETADDLGALGYDPIYGHGRINAARAVGLN